MADKTVNINIKYNVDTSQVQRAEAISQRAQQATDNLNRASTAYGNTAPQSYKKVNSSIESMTIQMQRLETQIKNTNLTDTKRLNQLSAQYKTLKANIDSANKALLSTGSATKTVTQESNNLAASFGNVVTAVKAVIAAQIVRQFVDISIEAARLSGNIEGVTRAFQRQIPNAEGVLNDLRKATRGTVTDLELMQRSLKFQNFGGNVQALPALLEFAAVRAQQTGQSIDYMVNSIVDGIGRKSIRVLDNLGLSATAIKAEMNGISMEAATVAQVSEAMGRIASRELERMGGFAETSATLVDQLTVSWHGLREELSKFFTEGSGGGIIGFMKEYVDSFKTLVEAYNKGISVSELYEERRIKEIANISASEFATRRLTGSKEENIAILEDEIQQLTKSLGEYAKQRAAAQKSIDFLKEEIRERRGHVYIMEENIELIKRGIDRKKEDATIDQEILKILQAKLIALKKEKDETTNQITTIKTLKDQLDELNKQRQEATSIGDTKELDRLKREILLLEDRILKIDNNIEWQKKWSDETRRAAFEQMQLEQALKDGEKAIAALEKQFEKLVSDVPSIKDSISQLTEEFKEQADFVDFGTDAAARFRIKLREAFEGAKDELIGSGTDIIGDQIQSTLQQEVDAYSARIDMARSFYDEQIELAGDNERRKKELRIKEDREIQQLEKERADREKKATLAGILTNTALSVAKTAAQLGFPKAWPFIAIAVAEGASQYAIASRARYYAKGKINIDGPGTETSDSIPAFLSKGESVITAERTRESFGLLKRIEAGQIDDRVLKKIDFSGGRSVMMDDKRILQALDEVKTTLADVIKSQKYPDLLKQGRQIYEVYQDNQGNKRRIRKQVMGD
jgi:hypothetical protein